MTNWRLLRALALLLVTTRTVPTQAQASDIEVTFKAAEQKELVAGDLPGAIAAYKQVAERAGANRALAAKALLRMAECYQKQGDVEARRIYQRVVREYADQRDVAALAQSRLGGPARADAGVAFRKVWSGDVLGTVSPDGRYLSYADWTSGNLTLHDFATNSDRPLTANKLGQWPASNEFAEESSISRDGTRVAYTWFDAKHAHYELRIKSINSGPGGPTRELFDNEEVLWIAPYDWSPDGKWIAVALQRKDRIAQIGLVNTADGSLRVLKSVDWRGPTKMFFSPDGRYLGYDLPVADSRQRDVFVLAVDGSREISAVVHAAQDIMMGWSPDGKQLLFASDRSGVVGLWALRFAEGKVQGQADAIQPNLGSAWSMGMTANGALYVGVATGGQDVEVASLDFITGKRLAPTVRPIPMFIGSNRDAEWSPDGKYLAYKSTRGLSAQGRDIVIGVLNVETGSVREVVPKELQYFNSISWSPDGSTFAVGGTDLKGRQGVFGVDAHTGTVAPIGGSTGELFVGQIPRWAPDGKHVYFRRKSDAGATLIVRDLTTGQERELLPGRSRVGGFGGSPDDRWIAVNTVDQATKASVTLLVPAQGGEAREIFRVKEPESLAANVLTWLRDGRGVLVRKTSKIDAQMNELWMIPVDGAPPVKLDINASGMTSIQLSVHPDGRRLAYTFGRPGTDIWVLERFLPSGKIGR